VKTKLFIPFAFVAVLALMAGCAKDPTACFTMTSESIDDDLMPLAGEEIDFENCSGEATSYNWDFDDGEESDDENPTYAFTEAGTYNVTLTATGDGGSKSTSQEIEIGDLAGTWEGSLTLDTEVYGIVFELEQEGAELNGTFEFDDGSGLTDLTSGSEVDVRNVTIKFTEPGSTYDLAFVFEGEINDDIDEMEGDYSVAGLGGGTWNVSKAKKKSAVNPNGKGLESFRKKF
jgi:PKD repeat protein